MIVIDASCLFEVVADRPAAESVRQRIEDEEHVAPHVIDVEVLGVIRRRHLLGELDPTAASLAVESLRRWPGERFAHQTFLDRAWELRDRVRGWDAMYVALGEALGVTLLTRDRRLARVRALDCTIELR